MKTNSGNLSYQIGRVAKLTGASIHTIRYYEKQGLLPKPVRSEGGFRRYPAETVERLRFIKKAQAFGLTLKEIKKILCCGDRGLEPCCAMVTKLFQNKIVEFETKIRDLRGTQRKLKRLLAGWTGK